MGPESEELPRSSSKARSRRSARSTKVISSPSRPRRSTSVTSSRRRTPPRLPGIRPSRRRRERGRSRSQRQVPGRPPPCDRAPGEGRHGHHGTRPDGGTGGHRGRRGKHAHHPSPAAGIAGVGPPGILGDVFCEGTGRAVPHRVAGDAPLRRHQPWHPRLRRPGPRRQRGGRRAATGRARGVLAEAARFRPADLGEADEVTLGCLTGLAEVELAELGSAAVEHTVTAMPFLGPPRSWRWPLGPYCPTPRRPATT